MSHLGVITFSESNIGGGSDLIGNLISYDEFLSIFKTSQAVKSEHDVVTGDVSFDQAKYDRRSTDVVVSHSCEVTVTLRNLGEKLIECALSGDVGEAKVLRDNLLSLGHHLNLRDEVSNFPLMIIVN